MGGQIGTAIVQGIIIFLEIFSWLIVINALLSWVIDRSHPLMSWIQQFIEPILAPFRNIANKINTGGLPIDISPLLAIIFLNLIIALLRSLI
ncbi:MAG: YggT family protein [Clostridia bacterium]|nr:YggT family protein [Clostridia bacterium]